MYINTVSLKNFRNYENITVKLNDKINILSGDNAQGKTNFLEAVYFCATGRSQRTHLDKELISFNKNEAHIQTFISKGKISDRIDVHIKKDSNKGIAVNGISVKKLSDLFGALYAVIFSPEDLNLIKSGPSLRRKFMDLEICQTNYVYYYELQQYYKILKQRNNLLKSITRDRKLSETLFLWDEQLVFHGAKIMAQRERFIEKINALAGEIHENITNGKEKLTVEYRRNITGEEFLHKLKKSADKDIIFGSTSSGIHKDDLIFLINGVDIRIFGSQGQQRTAALSAKLSEIEFIKQEKLVSPVLLLDDVFSELDSERQSFLLQNVKDIQTLITCTGIENIMSKINGDACIFTVKNGVIS